MNFISYPNNQSYLETNPYKSLESQCFLITNKYHCDHHQIFCWNNLDKSTKNLDQALLENVGVFSLSKNHHSNSTPPYNLFDQGSYYRFSLCALSGKLQIADLYGDHKNNSDYIYHAYIGCSNPHIKPPKHYILSNYLNLDARFLNGFIDYFQDIVTTGEKEIPRIVDHYGSLTHQLLHTKKDRFLTLSLKSSQLKTRLGLISKKLKKWSDELLLKSSFTQLDSKLQNEIIEFCYPASFSSGYVGFNRRSFYDHRITQSSAKCQDKSKKDHHNQQQINKSILYTTFKPPELNDFSINYFSELTNIILNNRSNILKSHYKVKSTDQGDDLEAKKLKLYIYSYSPLLDFLFYQHLQNHLDLNHYRNLQINKVIIGFDPWAQYLNYLAFFDDSTNKHKYTIDLHLNTFDQNLFELCVG